MPNDPDSLAPTLLVAMPQLQDPNFSRAVVLLCEHSAQGAMGLVVNRPSGTLASQVVQFDPSPNHESHLEVWIGGPVEPERGWLLVTEGASEGTEISPGLYLSASVERLRQAMESPAAPAGCRFLVGYAGWAPRQLDAELAASAWLTVPVDIDLVFNTPSDEMWESAIRQLGIDPHSLTPGPGVH